MNQPGDQCSNHKSDQGKGSIHGVLLNFESSIFKFRISLYKFDLSMLSSSAETVTLPSVSLKTEQMMSRLIKDLWASASSARFSMGKFKENSCVKNFINPTINFKITENLNKEYL